MANLTPAQIAMQRRFDRAIGLAAPLLDAVLGVGDRISRVVERTDHEYYPIRPGERVALPGEPSYDADRDAAITPPPPPRSDGGGRAGPTAPA